MDTLLRDIATSQKIAFFTGAGVSTASGLKDFRGKDGLESEGLVLTEELSHFNLVRNPSRFWQVWEKYLQIKDDIKPNIVHTTIAEIGKFSEVSVITQNIDGLHEKAGNTQVYALHGTSGIHCTKCKQSTLDYPLHKTCTKTSARYAKTRPNAVLYGERLPVKPFLEASKAIQSADLLIISGTSLQVYPAMHLLAEFYKGNIYFINNESVDEYPLTQKPIIEMIEDSPLVFQKIHDIIVS